MHVLGRNDMTDNNVLNELEIEIEELEDKVAPWFYSDMWAW